MYLIYVDVDFDSNKFELKWLIFKFLFWKLVDLGNFSKIETVVKF